MKYIFVLVCLMVVSGCIKEKISNRSLNSDLVASFLFKPGTYWIYKDAINGDLDSFFVTSNWGNKFISEDKSYSIDQITIYINQEPLLPSARTDTLKWKYLYEGNTIDIYYLDKNIYTNQIQYVPMTNYPFKYDMNMVTGGAYSSYTDSVVVNNIFDSFSVNGLNFKNVVETKHKADLIVDWNYPLKNPFHYIDTFYLCPNIGIIKMSLNHPQDPLFRKWELQRWNIVK